MYKVEISEYFKADLDEILDYIIYKLKNPIAAERFSDKLEEALNNLEYYPKINPNWEIEESEFNYKFIKIGNFLSFYIIEEENKLIIVSRLLYEKMNINEILKNNLDIEDFLYILKIFD